MVSSFTLLNLFNPTSQSPIWRAIAAPTIAPIPFAIKSIHEGSRPNKYWTNSIEPPKIITPKTTHIVSFAKLTIWVVLGVIIFGGSIELVQYLFGREPSWMDFIANGIGAIVGAAIARQIGLWLVGLNKFKSVKDETMNDA